MKRLAATIVAALSASFVLADDTNSSVNAIVLKPHIHDSLSDELLARIRNLTDTLEVVDGVSYEQAVDLYRRASDPGSALVPYEEIADAYQEFCSENCASREIRVEVLKVLTLRMVFPAEQALEQARLMVLSREDAIEIMSNYTLPPTLQ